MIQQNMYCFILEENGEIIRIFLNFRLGIVSAQNSKGMIIFKRSGLDYLHMTKAKESIENAIKLKKVTK